MRLLIEEYSSVLLTIVGGLIIISIMISSIISTNISINHSESIDDFNVPIEKIGIFECKDLYIDGDDYDLLKDVIALSNTNIDIKDKVITRIIDDEDTKYVEYVLKYCNDYRVQRAKLYMKEDDGNEDNV